MGVRHLCSRVADHVWFERTIILLIVTNAVVLGLETFPAVAAHYGEQLVAFNDFVLAVFVIEAVIKIVAVAPRYGRYLCPV